MPVNYCLLAETVSSSFKTYYISNWHFISLRGAVNPNFYEFEGCFCLCFLLIYNILQETQLAPYRRNMQDLLCDAGW